MPRISVVSSAGGTTIYTDEHATTNAPTVITVRIADDDTGKVSRINPERGDSLYADGVWMDEGESRSFQLISTQKLTLVAETGTVDVVFDVTEF